MSLMLFSPKISDRWYLVGFPNPAGLFFFLSLFVFPFLLKVLITNSEKITSLFHLHGI